MSVTVGRVDLMYVQMQGNLKGGMLEPKLVILNGGQSSKRGLYKSRVTSAESAKITSTVVSCVEFKEK